MTKQELAEIVRDMRRAQSDHARKPTDDTKERLRALEKMVDEAVRDVLRDSDDD